MALRLRASLTLVPLDLKITVRWRFFGAEVEDLGPSPAATGLKPWKIDEKTFAGTLTFARAALCSDRVTFMVMMLLMTFLVTLCLDVLMQVVRLLMLWLMFW